VTSLTEDQILKILAEGPARIYGGMPSDIYFDMRGRRLIAMDLVQVDDQETAVEIRLCSTSGERNTLAP
jgi:hypothetical protein